MILQNYWIGCAGVYAPDTSPFAPRIRTSIGRGALFCFMASGNSKEMGVSEVEAFLTHLAVERNVAASTQGQAKAALLFLYREVLNL